jgi:hypothetical protein
MLAEEEVPFFNCDTIMPILKRCTGDNVENLNLRASLLIKIGKIWMCRNLPLENPEISSLVKYKNSSVGVHAAALAIDGARLLLRSNSNLCGQPMGKAIVQGENDSNSFFSFRNILDIDDYSKAALSKTWASSANSSCELLFDAMDSGDTSEIEAKVCLDWLELLIPLLLRGLYDAIETMSQKSSSQDTVSWAGEVDAYEVACCCLSGLSTLAKSSSLQRVDTKWKQEIETATGQIYKFIFLPVLRENKHRRAKRNEKYNIEGIVNVVAKSCELFKTFSTSISFEEKSDSSKFLAILLRPLDLLEKKEVSLTNNFVATIVGACMKSVAGIIRMPTSPSALVKAMLSFGISLTSQTEQAIELVSSAAQELLEECLKHKSATMAELVVVTSRLAKQRNWTVWLSVVKIKDGIAAEESLLEIEKALLNPSGVDEQLKALGSIACLVQNSPPPNPLTGRILSALGAEVLSVFEGYGTLSDQAVELQSKRVAACADCMKIALASYQQFSADFSDGDTTEFLVMLFEAFNAVLRFNGLPNHPPPQGALSDSSIGRMCAQAITHIARTTPVPFKASMGGMSAQDRTILEFAVRGEMSGYAVAAAPAPVKKKLSLKGFKK